MRTTPIGLVMLSDERPHVNQADEAANVEVLNRAPREIEPQADAAAAYRELFAERAGDAQEVLA
ncbi:MAG: hypothetical protein ACXVRJ_05690 [Gaiellaceae bacterium]